MDPAFQENRNFSRDMFNVVVGTIWQTSLVLLPMYVVLHELAGRRDRRRRYRRDLGDSQEELVRHAGQGSRGRARRGRARTRRAGAHDRLIDLCVEDGA